jgi:hypothetical protein
MRKAFTTDAGMQKRGVSKKSQKALISEVGWSMFCNGTFTHMDIE